MRVEFTASNSAGPERLVAEAALVFESGVDSDHLAGLKIVGFSLWRGADGEVYVTFPSRAFGAGAEGRRFFDYLRSADGDQGPVKQLKALIVGTYKAQQADAVAS